MTVVERIATLRKGAVAWRQSPDRDVSALGEDLATWLDEGDGHLDTALGIVNGAGESWRLADAVRRRDDLLRHVAAEYYCGQKPSVAAPKIASDLSRFRSSAAWRTARTAAACPYEGERAFFWQILRLVDKPIGADRLRRILGAKPAYS